MDLGIQKGDPTLPKGFLGVPSCEFHLGSKKGTTKEPMGREPSVIVNTAKRISTALLECSRTFI